MKGNVGEVGSLVIVAGSREYSYINVKVVLMLVVMEGNEIY